MDHSKAAMKPTNGKKAGKKTDMVCTKCGPRLDSDLWFLPITFPGIPGRSVLIQCHECNELLRNVPQGEEKKQEPLIVMPGVH